jgi:hypothetical protein
MRFSPDRVEVRRVVTWWLSAFAVAFAGCSTPNPEFCCVTEQTCAAAGLHDTIRPCGVGQACRDYGCVVAECQTSEDCTSPEAPTCLDNLCVAGCKVDDDCRGISDRPHCADDGLCVGCTSSEQCPVDKAICDADTRSCRGCTADDQCTSGVCIEADGVCAADGEPIYVSRSGSDVGDCSRSAPCATLPFGLAKVSATRRVVRLVGTMFSTGVNPIPIYGAILDGANTTLLSSSAPIFSVRGPTVIEGVRFSAGAATPVIEVQVGGMLRTRDITVELGAITVDGGTLEASNVVLRNGSLGCTNGSVLVTRSDLERNAISSFNCKLELSKNHIVAPFQDSPIAAYSLGLLTIENNLFIGNDSAVASAFYNFAPGSSFRFNTMVNPSQLGGVEALFCERAGLNITSNIFAYNSMYVLSNCVARNSLFDLLGAADAAAGTENVSADAALFFKDRAAGDYHLATNSPALGLGQVGLVTSDLEGKSRPSPTGSAPDAGAYEAQ